MSSADAREQSEWRVRSHAGIGHALITMATLSALGLQSGGRTSWCGADGAERTASHLSIGQAVGRPTTRKGAGPLRTQPHWTAT